MQFEYDPERLIEEVKKRPGIWDFEDLNYRAKDMRHKLWSEVVEELLAKDAVVTKSEMRELELQLQKKWKSIRDCFHKYIQNPNRTKRPYIYCKQLHFLLKSPNLPAPEGGGGSSDSDDGEKYKRSKLWKTKKVLKLVKDEEQSSEDDNDNQAESASYSNDDTEATPMKMPRTSKSHAEDFVFASVDCKGEGEDSDKMFLLSLLPHLKSIPEEYRLNVKMDLMQVLRNANYTLIIK